MHDLLGDSEIVLNDRRILDLDKKLGTRESFGEIS